MKLRYVTALLAGILAFMTTMMAGWVMTDLEYLHLMLIALLMYFSTCTVTMILTEPRRKQERTRWEFRVYDLKKGGE